MSRLSSLCALLMASTLLVSPVQAQPTATPGPAAEKVGVRSGTHPTYSRLVFDWPRNTPYSVQQDGDQVTIRFPVAAEADLARVVRTPPPRITGLSQERADGALLVRFRIPAGAGIKDMRAGTRVVIDVLDKAPAAKPPAPAPEPTQASKPAPVATQAPTRLTPDPAKPAASPEKPAQTAAKPVPADPRRTKEGAPLFELRGGAAPGPGEPTAASAAPAPTPASPTPAPAPAGQNKTSVPATAPATPVPAPSPASQPAEQAGAMSIPFDPKAGTAAAVFERAGWLYILFDRPVPPETAPAPAAVPWLGSTIEPVTVPEAGGFRLPMPALMRAAVRRDGTAWHVDFNRVTDLPGADTHPTGLTATPDLDFALGPRLVVAVPDAGSVLSFKDPVVGDTLSVVPLSQPGPHVALSQRFAQAQLLPTLQGLVVRPLDDGLSVQPVREGVEITAPGGLQLSSAADILSVAPPPPPKKEVDRLYDFKRWGQVPAADYIKARQAKWDQLVQLPEAERNRGRLELARFYIANGLAYEAQGMLDRVQEVQPDVDRRPEFLAVRGIARALTRDYDGALADLGNSGLAGEADTDLWRAAALGGKQDYAAAQALFEARKEALANYPDPYFAELSLAAANTALEQNQPKAAAAILDRAVKRGVAEGQLGPALDYYRGKIFRAEGDNDKALAQFEKAMGSRDRLYAMRAKRDFIDTSLAAGKIDAKEAAKRMEEMRFAWIGDELELSNLRRIGEVHALAGNYPQAFDTMRRTIALFPDTPDAKEIAADMTRTFTDLFAKDGAAKMPALDALALYEQYRELTPPGPDGDRIIQKLAERMVEIDLLDRAAELLDHQVQYRLTGLDKARVGTRLAGIRLLDSKPAEALAALDRTQMEEMPADLVEERRLLRARALSQAGKGGEAVALLTDDRSRNANLLRVDIAMRDRQWAAAAAALGDLITPPPAVGTAIDSAQSKLVVNRAVALSLAQDNAGLDALRRDYGTAMDQGPDATAFQVLTRPEASAGLADAATIRSRITEIDLFRSFLDTYRAKQQETAAPAPAADPATAASPVPATQPPS